MDLPATPVVGLKRSFHCFSVCLRCVALGSGSPQSPRSQLLATLAARSLLGGNATAKVSPAQGLRQASRGLPSHHVQLCSSWSLSFGCARRRVGCSVGPAARSWSLFCFCRNFCLVCFFSRWSWCADLLRCAPPRPVLYCPRLSDSSPLASLLCYRPFWAICP